MAKSHAEKTAELQSTMNSLTWGCELETISLGCSRAAQVVKATIESTTGTTATQYGNRVTMADGRYFDCKGDCSIYGPSGCEIVSPIMRGMDADSWDMNLWQAICRALFAAGARTNNSCGMHVHIGVGHLDAATLCRAAKIVYSNEPLLADAFDVNERMGGQMQEGASTWSGYGNSWCKPISDTQIRQIVAAEKVGGTAREMANDLIRAANDRYKGLNFASYRTHTTIEFRYFNPTLHAGRVRTAIQICAGIVARAACTKSAVCRRRPVTGGNKRYAMRIFMIKCGMIGSTFDTARKFLTDHLPGDSSSFGTGNGRGGVAAVAANADVVQPDAEAIRQIERNRANGRRY
jgi:hypothetical protein